MKRVKSLRAPCKHVLFVSFISSITIILMNGPLICDAAFAEGQVWYGNYTCGQGLSDLALEITRADNTMTPRIEAVFNFTVGTEGCSGSFYLESDALVDSSATIVFAPGLWYRNPCGYAAVSVSGAFTNGATPQLFIGNTTCNAGLSVELRSTSYYCTQLSTSHCASNDLCEVIDGRCQLRTTLTASSSNTRTKTPALTSSASPTKSATRSASDTTSHTISPAPTASANANSHTKTPTLTPSASPMKFTHTVSKTRSRTMPAAPISDDIIDSPAETPPDENQRATSTSVVVRLGVSEPVADAITGTGATSTVASAIATPTVATQYSRIAASIRIIECSLASDDEVPPFFEHPLHPPIGNDGSVKHLAGGSLCSGIAVLASFLLLLGLRHQGAAEEAASAGGTLMKAVKLVSVGCSVMVAFFVPNAVGAAITVLVHGGTTAYAAVGVVALTCALAPFSFLFYVISHKFGAVVDGQHDSTSDDDGDDSSSDDDDAEQADDQPSSSQSKASSSSSASTSNGTQSISLVKKWTFSDAKPSSVYVAAFGPLFDAVSHPFDSIARCYFFEDVASATLLTAIAGTRPSSENCSTIGGALLAVNIAHLGFLLKWRPYRTRLESGFALLFAVTQCLLTLLCLLVATSATGVEDALLSVIGYLIIALSGTFFAQVFVQGIFAFWLNERRQQQQRMEGELGALQVPLADNKSSNTAEDVEMAIGDSTDVNMNPLLDREAAE